MPERDRGTSRAVNANGAMSGSPPVLEIEDLTTSLVVEGVLRPIVREMSLTIHAGEVVALVGESGSGKSITARSIIGLLPPGARSTGRIGVLGTDVLSLSRRELRRVRSHQIGMIFQDPRAHIDPLWPIEDYVGEGLRIHKGLNKSQARERSLALLSSLGITDEQRVLASFPGQLSGGMLQRVMIAGALSCEPRLLIADEATTALDVTVQSDILAILHDLQLSHGLSILFITHDLTLASVICDRVIVMYAGRPMAVQSAQDLFEAPAHPYAAALVAARPRVDRKMERLQVVPGRPASALEVTAGCPFRQRCTYAISECAEMKPSLFPLGPDVLTECIRAADLREQMREGVAAHHD
ncbi:MAG: ABC transporter ATP-binding protein [Candidatus Dormibacteraeota bacterium]|uniref:ABC transporter ATP-binding protein n=1 Tax=Candidatus Aeolococcus gillhamiae TaxID=3127015 RepID=A0A934K0S6_9BACT|nr:ABC transporter ATP-binding protein [Candidatus Dormibacteraeota bacterium]